MDDVRVGTQSWSYRGWIGPFYPPGIAASQMLEWYGRMFPTIEVDATFYGIPAESTLHGWRQQVPPHFVFSLKLPQEITHVRRLTGAGDILVRFVDRVRCLEKSLGPILVQLPPDFLPTVDTREALRRFVRSLPDTERWAVEFRHARWIEGETLDLLRDHRVAVTLVDGRWLRRATVLGLVTAPTANFHYLRFMGLDRGFDDYSRPQVDRSRDRSAWVKALRRLGDGVETVFGYFNNHFEGHAPHSARELQRLLGQTPIEPQALHPQAELF